MTGPFWAARAYARGSGQDHLGLGSVSSDRLLAGLSPGVNVLTVHPRYWSFYAFLLDEFWARDLPRSRTAFRDFYRPREALYSFACQLCEQTEHETLTSGIVGSRRTYSVIGQEEFDPAFDYIKEPLGGYGLYYRTVMETLGLVVLTDPATGVVFDAPTPEGRAVAAGYRSAIDGTRFYRDYFAACDTAVPRDVLVEFAAAACLCQLRAAAAVDLPLLQDVFLHHGELEEAGRRRGSFRFFLDFCRTTLAEPVSQDRFRQLAYFRELDGERYAPLPGVLGIARRWRIYQAREYFAFAFNRLWAWVTRRGLELSGDGLSLVPLSDLWAVITGELDDNGFCGDLPDPGIRADMPGPVFADWLTGHVDVTLGVDDVWPRHDELDEHVLYAWCANADDDAGTLIAMLAILLLVHRRLGSAGRQADLGDDAELLAEGGGQRIGMTRFYGLLQRRLVANQTIAELLQWIITDFVIVQHERVATAKLPDSGDTFRFRRVGDALRFFPADAPVAFNDSRFGALSTIVHELGLVSSLTLEQRELTAAGRALLTDGDLPAGVVRNAAAAFRPENAG
ncbi:hypothetical protein [Actinoplanes auranticolor]|uniref:Uncharacterized protein n=1 Tax=Actinoplanes auranticolor TaxID=47988 RepID=A0A919SYP3_9ACTN|nr:hypothetical protein [Actinoplanes auranticolor]GIM80134.1 hypothetical protein Aau02nite_89140 [Actinoplanes auranticolor]